MRPGGRQRRGWRAACGVVVLYALVLQALLGGVAAARTSAKAPGAICLDHAGVQQAAQRDEPAGGPHDGCCQAACRAAQVVPPDAACAPLRPARRALTRQPLRCTLPVEGPPARIHVSAGPRAPPAVA